MTSCMSYGWLAESGMRVSSSMSSAVRLSSIEPTMGSVISPRGAAAWLLDGR